MNNQSYLQPQNATYEFLNCLDEESFRTFNSESFLETKRSHNYLEQEDTFRAVAICNPSTFDQTGILQSDTSQYYSSNLKRGIEVNSGNLKPQDALINDISHIPYFPDREYHTETYFLSSLEINTLIISVTNVLNNFLPEIAMNFSLSDSRWNCACLSADKSCVFDINVYRLGNVNPQSYAIELQRLEGDRWIFYQIFNALTSINNSNQHIDNPNCGRETSLPSQAIPSNVSTLKLRVVELLENETVSIKSQGAQLACDVYCNTKNRSSEFDEIDHQCISLLVQMIMKSHTIGDWSCQHAAWALSQISFKSSKHCEAILHSDINFIAILFHLAVDDGNYATATFRKKCVEIILNLYKHNKPELDRIFDSSVMRTWLNAPFTRSVKA